MPPSLSHVLLSPLPFALAAFGAAFSWYWAGVAGVALYWGGRELAQSMRPSAPLRFKWSWVNTRNFVQPVAAAAAVAAAIEVLQ